MRRDFPVSNTGLAAAFESISEFIRLNRLDEGLVHRFSVILDELCANMIRHDHTLTENTNFELSLSRQGRNVHMEVSDPGMPFNPLEFRHAETPEIGGHGISLVKGLSSAVGYERAGDRNILRVTVDTAD